MTIKTKTKTKRKEKKRSKNESQNQKNKTKTKHFLNIIENWQKQRHNRYSQHTFI